MATKLQKQRAGLMALAGEYASLFGESQFKRGYRCGKGQAWWDTPDAIAVEKREDQLYTLAQDVRKKLDKALTKYAREVRRDAKGSP